MWNAREVQAAVALAVGSVVAVCALWMPPMGEVSQSALMCVAQFLVLCATLLGIKGAMERMKMK